MPELRSALSLALALFFMVGFPGAPLMFFVVMPVAWLFPRWRLPLITWYTQFMSRGILFFLGLGGARFRRTGEIYTKGAGLIVMNHQSLLDACCVVLMCRPVVPAFVARAVYAHQSVPIVSTCIRLAGCPVIDPHDREGSVRTMARAVVDADRALLIFPEGHRTRTGEVLPFHTRGMVAMLTEARMPVWLVVTDGFWRSPTLIDFVRGVHLIDGQTELVRRYDPPAEASELPAFCERVREDLIAHLGVMRTRSRAPAVVPMRSALPSQA